MSNRFARRQHESWATVVLNGTLDEPRRLRATLVSNEAFNEARRLSESPPESRSPGEALRAAQILRQMEQVFWDSMSASVDEAEDTPSCASTRIPMDDVGSILLDDTSFISEQSTSDDSSNSGFNHQASSELGTASTKLDRVVKRIIVSL